MMFYGINPLPGGGFSWERFRTLLGARAQVRPMQARHAASICVWVHESAAAPRPFQNEADKSCKYCELPQMKILVRRIFTEHDTVAMPGVEARLPQQRGGRCLWRAAAGGHWRARQRQPHLLQPHPQVRLYDHLSKYFKGCFEVRPQPARSPMTALASTATSSMCG